jgi:hypothetical protein
MTEGIRSYLLSAFNLLTASTYLHSSALSPSSLTQQLFFNSSKSGILDQPSDYLPCLSIERNVGIELLQLLKFESCTCRVELRLTRMHICLYGIDTGVAGALDDVDHTLCNVSH